MSPGTERTCMRYQCLQEQLYVSSSLFYQTYMFTILSNLHIIYASNNVVLLKTYSLKQTAFNKQIAIRAAVYAFTLILINIFQPKTQVLFVTVYLKRLMKIYPFAIMNPAD